MQQQYLSTTLLLGFLLAFIQKGLSQIISSAQQVKCTDSMGFKYVVGTRMAIHPFEAECRATLNGTGVWNYVGCLDGNNHAVPIGARFNDKKRHIIQLCTQKDEQAAIQTLSCMDSYGRTKNIGDEWREMNRYVGCVIAPDTRQGKVMTVACAQHNADGTWTRKENGQKWTETINGKQYPYSCLIKNKLMEKKRN